MGTILTALGSIASLFFISIFTGCTSNEKPIDPTQVRLEKKMAEAVNELARFEEKIKDAKQDHGLRDQLVEERELLKSRLERLKERYKAEGGTLTDLAQKPAAGGH